VSLKEHLEAAVGRSDGIPYALQPVPGSERRKSAAHALIAAAREPMAALDRNFRVTAANRAFHQLFPATFSTAVSRPFCEPARPNWGAVALETLADVVASNIMAEDIEIEVDVPGTGLRRVLLNARRISDRDNPDDAVAVGLTDVTDQRLAEQTKRDVAGQHATLLQEAHHRIANSLQIIASILLLKARSVDSEETRTHLRDVHKRLILVATVQRQLCSAGMLDEIEFGPYVAQLCEGLADSMTEHDDRVTILTSSTAGKIRADDAISFGLIVTELVLNALKHGFPDGRRGTIAVNFDASGAGWRLCVSDDGVGHAKISAVPQTGLGTNIVEALARHLKARVEIADGGIGSSTAIIHTGTGA
jgi:two-component sensor histidine kinase